MKFEDVDAAFRGIRELEPHNSNCLAVFALFLQFPNEDITTLSSECVVDSDDKKTDDKKIDVIYLNPDFGLAIVIQATYKSKVKQAAPSNKAKDLNTAAAWLINAEMEEIPSKLKPQIEQFRKFVQENKITDLQFWYVHNLPESENVDRELKVVATSASSNIKVKFPGSQINVTALEVGQNNLIKWYSSLSTPILVTDPLELDVPKGYLQEGDKWRAYATSVPATWLYELYSKYKSDIFSANVRGYLGSTGRDENINKGIKDTCKSSPENFWVYNNGVTCIVHQFSTSKLSETEEKLKIKGLSVVNGAQTTGAIGSLEERPDPTAKLQIRFVECRDENTIKEIIKYNNLQNKIAPSDFRSNDDIQSRLREEFQTIPDAEYFGRRGGSEDIIRRKPNLLKSDTVAQALAAFHGDPITAYNQKSKIWQENSIYVQFFNWRTTAVHIVFTYSLLRAVEGKKRELIDADFEELQSSQKEQLNFFRNRGSTFLLVAAIGNCLELFLNRAVPDTFKVSFGEISPEAATRLWNPIVETTLPFFKSLQVALSPELKKSKEDVDKALNDFKSIVESVKIPNKSTFDTFAAKVVFS